MMKKTMQNMFIMLLLTTNTQSWVHAGSIEVGTQFTYQGELIDNGSPASGTYDFNIQLYNSGAGGSLLDTNVIQDVDVSNGLVNLTLDYGDAPFDGEESYLQINVRPGSSNGVYEPLDPRQRINVTPYAIQAAFVENGGSPWIDVTGGINYSQQVFVGPPSTSNSLLTTNSALNESPFRARINGSTKFSVQSNGGVSVGTGTDAPANGLYVQSNAQQNLSSHGFVKAATLIQCGAGINGGSESFFNNINGNDFSTSQNGAAGGCSITVPFDISNAFFTVSAHAIGGVNVFETVVASCSAFSSTQIQCQLHQISGANTSLSNGVVQLTIY